MSLEEETKQLEEQVKTAAATQNIGALLSLLVETSSLSPADYIKKTVGNLMFIYYCFLDNYKTRPVDIDDLVDGILYIGSRNYIQEKEIQKIRNRAQNGT